MPTFQAPPGHMGRLWLLGRLELAARGVTLLEEKLRLPVERRKVLQRRVDRTRQDWHDACREADAWRLRAGLLGGQRAITIAAPRTPSRDHVAVGHDDRCALPRRCAVRVSARRRRRSSRGDPAAICGTRLRTFNGRRGSASGQ